MAKAAAKKKATKKKAPKAGAGKKKVAKKTATKKKAPKKKATKKKATKKKAAKKKATKKTVAKKKVAKTASTAVEPTATGAPPAGTNGTSAARKRRSKAKRKAALAIVVSTSARMAVKAKASVWAISSERTIDQYEKIEERADGIEANRMEALAEAGGEGGVSSELRRCSRDPFGSFRTELSRPEDDPDDPRATWRAANQRLRHEMSSGASNEDLEAFEGRIEKTLPPSYWDFCLEWNGGMVYVHQGGCFRVLAAQEIIDEVKGPICGRMMRPYLPLVDLGCGDYLALDMSKTNKSGENPLYWWYMGEVKRKVADSFALWLKRLVESGGSPFWWTL